MNWLEFIVELVKALAWPTSVAVAVLLIRRPIVNLIPTLKSLKAGGDGVEMEFDKDRIVIKEAKLVAEVEGKSQAAVLMELTPRSNAEHQRLKGLITKELSQFERVILILYYYEEYTFDEIAAKLDMKPGEVRKIHTQTIGKLRANMTAPGAGDT